MKLIKHVFVCAAFFVLAGLCFTGCSEDECATCPTEEPPVGSNITIEWLHPQPAPADFTGLWVAGTNNVFMCGESGIVYRWYGSGWTQYSTGVAYGLNAIWGSSAGDVFAVGDGGAIVHFDGVFWRRMQSNVLHSLAGVWGSAPDDVYVIGYSGGMIHYDGLQWEIVDHGLVTGDDSWYLYDIWGTGPDDIFVVGYRRNGVSSGVVWHYNGTAWSETLVGSRFYAVWGTASNNVFAGGDSGQLYRFDGSNWLAQPNLTGTDINSIWGSAVDDIWAVGEKYDYGISRYVGAVWRFNGISWIDVGGTTFLDEIHAIGGSASNDVYLVGEGNQLARFDGSGWSFISDLRVTGNDLSGIWGFSSNDLWAAGEYGTIVHFDGTDWTSVASPTEEYLSGLWGTAPNNLYAVGSGGTILAYNGSAWNEVLHGLTTESLQAIWGTSAGNVWVGGASGKMLYFNGTGWEDRSIDAISTGWVQDIWGSSVDDYYAIVDGSILRYNGVSWAILPLEGYYAGAVHGSAPNQVYFVVSQMIGLAAQGANPVAMDLAQPPPSGGVFRFNGSEFIEMNIGVEGSGWLHDIWVFGANNIFLLADPNANVIHYNGSKATTATPEGQTWLSNLWGFGTNTIYATGSMGTVIRATTH